MYQCSPSFNLKYVASEANPNKDRDTWYTVLIRLIIVKITGSARSYSNSSPDLILTLAGKDRRRKRSAFSRERSLFACILSPRAFFFPPLRHLLRFLSP